MCVRACAWSCNVERKVFTKLAYILNKKEERMQGHHNLANLACRAASILARSSASMAVPVGGGERAGEEEAAGGSLGAEGCGAAAAGAGAAAAVVVGMVGTSGTPRLLLIPLGCTGSSL